MCKELTINWTCPECLSHSSMKMAIKDFTPPTIRPRITMKTICPNCGIIMLQTDNEMLTPVRTLLKDRYYVYNHCDMLSGTVYYHNSGNGPYIKFGPVFAKERDVLNRIMHDPNYVTAKIDDENFAPVTLDYSWADDNTVTIMCNMDEVTEDNIHIGNQMITKVIAHFSNRIAENNPKRRMSTNEKTRREMGNIIRRHISVRRLFDNISKS